MLSPDYIQKLNRLRKLYEKFPNMAAIEAVNFSKERFVRKNWVNKTPEPWKKPKPVPAWVPNEWRKKGGSLLIGKGSGRLKRSIRKIKVTQNSVTIGTDVPYAQIHNEGGTIKQNVTIKAHSRQRKGRTERVKEYKRKRAFKIPQRQFIGESAILLRRIERMVQREMTEILK
jgi:phage gpG-like protein